MLIQLYWRSLLRVLFLSLISLSYLYDTVMLSALDIGQLSHVCQISEVYWLLQGSPADAWPQRPAKRHRNQLVCDLDELLRFPAVLRDHVCVCVYDCVSLWVCPKVFVCIAQISSKDDFNLSHITDNLWGKKHGSLTWIFASFHYSSKTCQPDKVEISFARRSFTGNSQSTWGSKQSTSSY